jgi:hypothetical protein
VGDGLRVNLDEVLAEEEEDVGTTLGRKRERRVVMGLELGWEEWMGPRGEIMV